MIEQINSDDKMIYLLIIASFIVIHLRVVLKSEKNRYVGTYSGVANVSCHGISWCGAAWRGVVWSGVVWRRVGSRYTYSLV